MLLDIVSYPDPSLRKKCAPIERIGPEIRELAANMLETMYSAPGVGLAAPQVGRNIRLLVMDASAPDSDPEPRIFINPELEAAGELIVSEKEGCLSVPLGFRADVPRHSMVHVRSLDIDGKPLDEILEGFAAIVLQHEADHLDGMLFIDRIGHLRKSLYDGKVKKWLKNRNTE